jgi:hypothetical protein
VADDARKGEVQRKQCGRRASGARRRPGVDASRWPGGLGGRNVKAGRRVPARVNCWF